MADLADLEVKGLKELQRKNEQMIADLIGAPILTAMRDNVLDAQRGAKINSPIDRGRLRASITPSVSVEGQTVRGAVGTNVEYAAAMEFGTGTQSEGSEEGAGTVHFPPWTGSLVGWARRHGIPSAFLVARAIGRRGGLEARRYMQKALEDAQPRIKARFEKALKIIVEKRPR